MRIKKVMAWIIVSTILLIVGMVAGSVTSSAVADKNDPPPDAAQIPDTGTTTQDAQENPGTVYISRGSLVDQFAVYANNSPITTSSTGWAYTGYNQYVTVPAGLRALVNARFSAESLCYRGAAPVGNWCRLRMIISAAGVGSFEMYPVAGTEFAFDSPGYYGSSDWESHSIDRFYVVPARSVATTWHVYVYYGVTNASMQFRLDDGQLTVEKARVP